jgi:diguanylate cyclase (GGDEF)-like protein
MRPAHLALVAALYFAGAKLGMLTVMPEGIAVLWPPNAVVLAALIRFRGERLWLLGLVVVAAEVAADVPTFRVTEALAFGLIHFAEAVLAWQLLERLRFSARFAAPADLWKFVVAGPLAAAFCAALLGAAVYSLFRGGETTYLEFARLWWFGDALGLLIFTPLLLGFPPFRTDPAPAPIALAPLDAAVWLAAAAAVLLFWLSPWTRAQLGTTLLLPFVVFAAARYPQRWAAVVVAAAAGVLVVAMTRGKQPFGPLPAHEEIIHAQEFILIMALIGQGFASLLAQLRARQAELVALNAELEARVAERTAELERLASLDPLSGVANRRSFDERLKTEVAQAARYGGKLALVLADIDRFKRVNDDYGHQVGDEVIRAVAQRLRACAREVDLVARYGGEEFAVLLPRTSLQQAVRFAERARCAVAAETFPSLGVRVTASFGVAEWEPGARELHLLEQADARLYRAKRNGRDRVEPPP